MLSIRSAQMKALDDSTRQRFDQGLGAQVHQHYARWVARGGAEGFDERSPEGGWT